MMYWIFYESNVLDATRLLELKILESENLCVTVPARVIEKDAYLVAIDTQLNENDAVIVLCGLGDDGHTPGWYTERLSKWLRAFEGKIWAIPAADADAWARQWLHAEPCKWAVYAEAGAKKVAAKVADIMRAAGVQVLREWLTGKMPVLIGENTLVISSEHLSEEKWKRVKNREMYRCVTVTPDAAISWAKAAFHMTGNESLSERQAMEEQSSNAYPQDAEGNEYRWIEPKWLDAIARGLTKGAAKHPGETWRQIPAEEHAVRAIRHLNLYRAGMAEGEDNHLINAAMRCMMAFAVDEKGRDEECD